MFHAPRPHYHHRRRGRNDQGANISPMVIMLCMKVWQAYQDSPVKPPVIFAMACWYNIAAHVDARRSRARGNMPFSRWPARCASRTGAFWAAWCARDLVEVAVRTFGSVFTHADDMHLYWNMGSLLVKGVLLEDRLGSEALAVFVAFSIVASSGIQLVVAPFLARAFGYDCGCAVGFSGVLFAMKVVLNYGDHAAGSNATSSVWGVRVASRHAHWLEILVSGYLSPRSSLVGHACGALAGMLLAPATSTPCPRQLVQGGAGAARAGAEPLHGRARHGRRRRRDAPRRRPPKTSPSRRPTGTRTRSAAGAWRASGESLSFSPPVVVLR